ncbi:hypothetical protein MPUL_45930 [Mycolicibacterium pulveris]|uniref:VWFA domain-containing protein n=1 Tax=Mycolicibacterium pulveris TaxID=36813 RepID=A0A7I7UPT1_MYCPV|nr:hypothetical protein MPUL_45930 [Mycolicibacterium pulveris]
MVYEQSIATVRDLSILVLLDASGSTNEAVEGDRVFARERLLAGQLVASFDYLGSSVAAYGFYSLGRRNVRFLRIKTFSESFDEVATQRLLSIEPRGFTRLGAALRHATHLLLRNAPAKNMALIVIGDGLPFDDDYEGRYARADTRQAIREACWSGVGVVGLAIRSSTEPFVHRDIWSHVPFRVVADSAEARSHLRALLSNALRMTRTNGQVPPSGVTDVSAFAISRRSGLNSYV